MATPPPPELGKESPLDQKPKNPFKSIGRIFTNNRFLTFLSDLVAPLPPQFRLALAFLIVLLLGGGGLLLILKDPIQLLGLVIVILGFVLVLLVAGRDPNSDNDRRDPKAENESADKGIFEGEGELLITVYQGEVTNWIQGADVRIQGKTRLRASTDEFGSVTFRYPADYVKQNQTVTITAFKEGVGKATHGPMRLALQNTPLEINLLPDEKIPTEKPPADPDTSPPPPPPLPTSRSPSTNAVKITADSGFIPEKADKLIGRDELLATVREKLRSGGKVLLQGDSGLGKTALASETVAQYIKEGKEPILWWRAEDAGIDVCYFELVNILAKDKTSIVENLQGAARQQFLFNLLSPSESGVELIVLDDVNSGPSLEEIMKALPPQTALLVTSQNRFAYPNLKLYEVSPLSAPDALNFLNHYSGVERANEDVKGASDLCAALGNIPYYLLTAALTLNRDRQTPGQLFEEFKDKIDTLELQHHTKTQASYRALQSVRLSRLEVEDREAFIAFGAFFDHSATPELISIYLGIPLEAARKHLDTLWDTGFIELVSASETLNKEKYYKVHNLAYSFARSQLSGDYVNKVIAACFTYVKNYKDDLRFLDAEINNIIAAASASVSPQVGKPEILVEIMHLLAVEGPYLEARGYNPRVLPLIRQASDFAKAQEKIEIFGELLDRLAYSYANYLGQKDKAIETYQDVLKVANEFKNLELKATILPRLGTLYLPGEPDKAEKYYDEAETISKDHLFDKPLALVYQHRSFYFLTKKEATSDDYLTGINFADEAIKIATKFNLSRIKLAALINRGGCQLELQKPDEALQTHQEVLQIANDINHDVWRARALESLGEDYDALGNIPKAQECFDQAIALWKKIDSKTRLDDLIEFIKGLPNNYSTS